MLKIFEEISKSSYLPLPIGVVEINAYHIIFYEVIMLYIGIILYEGILLYQGYCIQVLPNIEPNIIPNIEHNIQHNIQPNINTLY